MGAVGDMQVSQTARRELENLARATLVTPHPQLALQIARVGPLSVAVPGRHDG